MDSNETTEEQRKRAKEEASKILPDYLQALDRKDFKQAASMVPALCEIYRDGYGSPQFVLTLMHLAKGGHIDHATIKAYPVFQTLTEEFFDCLKRFNGTAKKEKYHYAPILRALVVIEMVLKLEATEVPFHNWEKDGTFPLRRDTYEVSETETHDNGGFTFSMEWAARQLKTGQPEMTNPATGAFSQTPLSVAPALVLMRDSDEVVLASTEHVLGCAFGGLSGYLLVNERVVLVALENSQLDRNRLIFALVASMQQADKMFAHAEKHARADRLCGLEMRERHIGHYCWNVLPAWSSLHTAGALEKATDVAYWSDGNVFGNPTDLYPEILSNVEHVHALSDIDACFDLIARENVLLILMQDRYVFKELADRITAYSVQNATDFGKDLLALRDAGRAVVLLTIRTSRRKWSEQVEGYVHMIDRLHEHYPDTVFYIDGATGENLKESTHRLIDLTEENSVADAIIAGVRKPQAVVNAVGVCMADSITLSTVAAFFVAPAGSGMTKYKWITNKPGIAHANHSVLNMGLGLSGPLRVWDHYRDDIIPAQYVDIELVKNNTAPGDTQSDYTIDIDALADLTLKFAAEIFTSDQDKTL